MSRIVYVNGRFVPFEEATIPIMDRGFLFADGIYEVSAVLNGRLVDNEAHLARLDRSLSEIGIRNPHTIAEWTRLEEELVTRNGLSEGLVYMEVTRGVAERDFAFPPEGTPPTVVMFTQGKNVSSNPLAERGAKVISVEDLRWKRRDIKSVALLAQVWPSSRPPRPASPKPGCTRTASSPRAGPPPPSSSPRMAASSPARSRRRSCPASPAGR